VTAVPPVERLIQTMRDRTSDDDGLRFGLRKLLAIPLVYAIAVPLWHVSIAHFVAGLVAATAITGVILLSGRLTYSRIFWEFGFGFMGAFLGFVVLAVVLETVQSHFTFFRVVGATALGAIVGWVFGGICSRR
jgi:hypothetical protein